MVESVLDRGGEIGADALPSSQQNSVVARSGGWGNIALVGAGIGLISAMGGIAIGYGAFHRAASTTAAAEPAKASDRAVNDVMGSPDVQRAQLANQLGQAGAPQTDIFGRPIAGAPTQPAVDTNGNVVSGPASTSTGTSSGQQTPAQRRVEQARLMADASRRSPIMAFGAGPTSVAATAAGGGDGMGQAPGQGTGQIDADGRPSGRSMVATSSGQSVGASGFGAPGEETGVQGKGTTDFNDQLAHTAIQTVRATMVADRNLLLSAGTVIPCTLQTAINSTQAGFVSCVINHDVYSENGRVVLLDKGTKVLGQYSGGIAQGQARLFVLWTRALTPRGVAIDLGSPAADSLGRAGLPGGVDTQFWARFGVGLVISVLEDASNIASRAVAGQGTYTTQVPGTTAQTVLQNTMTIKPILKKNQGDTAAIFVAKDFDFRSVYAVRLRR
ncbi:type IV secretion system protein VirB10 (plasmid) [Sphingomonas aliaeris]|uniref:Type IV secretion system protein VirB10 n=1 Tax=Sphingomonas aliaeris TaxID=2759526 RepID=A0A974NYZ9_9SPHN|nr:type IV secretion system protein VirB10 [Sphingomonas aliaeris]QQV79471.1 type IV secretion system protein VirB10 [Sphingomonas aliaeris]